MSAIPRRSRKRHRGYFTSFPESRPVEGCFSSGSAWTLAAPRLGPPLCTCPRAHCGGIVPCSLLFVPSLESHNCWEVTSGLVRGGVTLPCPKILSACFVSNAPFPVRPEDLSPSQGPEVKVSDRGRLQSPRTCRKSRCLAAV